MVIKLLFDCEILLGFKEEHYGVLLSFYGIGIANTFLGVVFLNMEGAK